MDKLNLLIDQFLSHCKYEKNLSPLSLKAYFIDLHQFQKFSCVSFSINSINELDKYQIRNYLVQISGQYKPKTIKRKLATLKAFANYLEYEDILVVNPFRKLRLRIQEGKQLPRTIELRNIKKLFAYLYTEKTKAILGNSGSFKNLVRDIAILELLFATGMRVSELTHLRRKNLNLTKGEVLVKGKGNRERIIPIPENAVIDALNNYYQLFKSKLSEESHFFINRINRKLSEQSVRLMIRKHVRSVHLSQHITPHMFRHSVATFLLENGVDIRYIQSILGHSSINTTQIYAQVNEAPKRKILKLKHPRRQFAL